MYLLLPYLWEDGPLELIALVYKMVSLQGVELPRDAYQQAVG